MTSRLVPLLLGSVLGSVPLAPATAEPQAAAYMVSVLPGATASFTPMGAVLPPMPPSVTPQPAAPSEVPLWRLFHAGRLVDLQRAIRRLQRQYPAWKPTAELRRQLSTARSEQALQAALRQGEPAALVAFARRHPEPFERQVDRQWLLAAAYAQLKEPQQAKRILSGLLAAARSRSERAATLERARQWLPPADYLDCLRLALNAVHDPSEHAALQARWCEAAFASLQAALKAGNREPAERLSGQLTPLLIARHDWPRALTLAWLNLDRHQPQEARAWFERVMAWHPQDPDAAYGLALLAIERGEASEAERLARLARLDQAAPRQLLATLLLERSRGAYEAGRYADCLELLAAGERLMPLTSAQLVQRAWALYHQEAYGPACEAFARAFEQAPSEETAQGLFYSHLKAGRLAQLKADVPLLAPLFRSHLARTRYYQKQFLTALRLAPRDNPALAGLDAPLLGSTGRAWSRSGDEGTSALTGWAIPALDMAVVPGGQARVRLQVDRLQVDAGSQNGDLTVGSVPLDLGGLTATLHPAYSWLEPRLWISFADGPQVEAMVSAGPLGTSVSPLPSLSLGLRSEDPWGPFALGAFVLPVQDSVLSWLGMPDPYAAESWGRTHRFGLSGSQRLALGGPYQLQMEGMVAYLSGERVAPNQQGRLSLGLQRDLGLPSLDYGVLGLQATYEGYQRNLSHFTLGHGGYYSPQLSLGTQLTWDARTPEAWPWMLSMHLGTGPAFQHLDAAPYFPLAPDGRMHQGLDQWAWGIDGEIKGSYQLTERIQLGAALQFGRTPSYDQRSLLLSARYSFAARRAVLSEDLP